MFVNNASRLEYKMDMQTGKNYARIIPKSWLIMSFKYFKFEIEISYKYFYAKVRFK